MAFMNIAKLDICMESVLYAVLCCLLDSFLVKYRASEVLFPHGHPKGEFFCRGP